MRQTDSDTSAGPVSGEQVAPAELSNDPAESEPLCEAGVRDEAPTRQTGSSGPDIETDLRAAFASLAARPTRDPVTGRYILGGLAENSKTLLRSEAFWATVEPAKQALVGRVETQLGLGGDDAPETLAGLVDSYAEARLFRQSMFLRLVDGGGPITHKGRTKALYTAYLSALDRETRLAQILGLERRSRDVSTLSLSEYLNQPETEE